LSAVRHFLDAIKFEHTVFALPFAYVAMVLAADGWPGWRVVVWVTLAMGSARTLAMSVNRLADRFIDAANPRTAKRHLPTGLLTPVQVTAGGARVAGVDEPVDHPVGGHGTGPPTRHRHRHPQHRPPAGPAADGQHHGDIGEGQREDGVLELYRVEDVADLAGDCAQKP